MEVNDVVKYSRPQSEEEQKFRFHVLEIHRDVENPTSPYPANLRLAHQTRRGRRANRH